MGKTLKNLRGGKMYVAFGRPEGTLCVLGNISRNGPSRYCTLSNPQNVYM